MLTAYSLSELCPSQVFEIFVEGLLRADFTQYIFLIDMILRNRPQDMENSASRSLSGT
jgi:hypothetical protein